VNLRFHNTWTRALEDFVPIDPANVRVYACGPTVYARIHIGNARMTVAFDLLYRLLRQAYGPDHVTYVSNITDIDDKIIAAAGENLGAIYELTTRMAACYDADRAALGCLRPNVEPKATDYVDGMIAMIERLIASGNAYEAEGHVLFAVETSPEYGRLSGHSREDQIAGARVEVAPYKKDPADFVLWKPSSSNYPGWNSPWGFGRPGWHIECSVMTADTLGEVFDIHGGGIDLTFPHHENEIAQSRCAHGGAVPANTWMHNGHVMVAGRKMSKSLGNFITVEDLLKRWPGEAIRLALLSAQYRQPLNVTEDLLAASKARLDYLYGVLRRQPPNGDGQPDEAMLAALSDDMNTPLAMSALQALAGRVEQGVAKASDLLVSAGILGLLQQQPDSWFQWQAPSGKGLAEAEIESLIEDRRRARAERDFAGADAIRKQLLDGGVALEDTAAGTIWKRISP
jgi:cysteinyl-tRNA synthetase